MKILVTPTSFGPKADSPAKKRLEAFADELVYNPHGRPLQEDELIPLLEGCDGYLAGLDFVGRRALESAKKLRVVSRYGVGCDRVDLAAAGELGIPVTNTPGVNANAVADLAFGLMLAVARRIPALDASTRAGGWRRSTGRELYGKTLGILGLGAIGRCVVQRAHGFGMAVLAYDPYFDSEWAGQNGVTCAPLDQVVRRSDFISLHLPLSEETRHLFGAARFAAMRPGAVLINTSRGGIIDEAAAADALRSGALGGLGLDAFEAEPPGESPLAAFDNVVMTPHTGAHTLEATEAMANAAVNNLIAVLTGAPCDSLVTATATG